MIRQHGSVAQPGDELPSPTLRRHALTGGLLVIELSEYVGLETSIQHPAISSFVSQFQ